jgi:hypothetical protein
MTRPITPAGEPERRSELLDYDFKTGHRFGVGWARPWGRLFTPAHQKPQDPRPGQDRFGVELLSGRVALRSGRRLGVSPNGKPTP